MITTLGFDADDTLWHNENLFEDSHRRFQALLAKHHDGPTVERALFATEMRNLELYGYGVKGFALSSIETAIELTDGNIRADELRELIAMAKSMLAHPVELLDGAAEVVRKLSESTRLIVITKGDLHHQERKVAHSGLAAHFAHVEIVSEKDTPTYARLLERHAVKPENFLMIGNSLRSDILPVLQLGAHAAYIPYPLTWAAEKAEPPQDCTRFHTLKNLRELPALVARLNGVTR